MSKNYIFSSESVGEGHPDKVCDTISDAILDACLAQDKSPSEWLAKETSAASNVVVIGGEITTKANFDYNQVVREAIRGIGYINDDDVFHADKVFINTTTSQSGDIAQGVDAKAAKGKATAEQGAGDQGLMFGFACDETPELMPAPIMFAHRIGRELTRVRKSGKTKWLRPDAKSQCSVRYANGKLVEITSVVVSTQHTDDVSHKQIHDFITKKIVHKVLPKRLLTRKTQYLVNPTGRFVVRASRDAGLTGRKIIVDTHGGMGRHGGGGPGKDPSKVDRSAAYMGRYVAKNVVAAGLASRCEVQFAYAIGYPDPVSVAVDTFGDAGIASDEAIAQAVQSVFSFKPADIVKQAEFIEAHLRFNHHHGYFGKVDDPKAITWRKTNKAAALKKALRA